MVRPGVHQSLLSTGVFPAGRLDLACASMLRALVKGRRSAYNVLLLCPQGFMVTLLLGG